MGVGAIGGVNAPDYSWYTPGGISSDSDMTDFAIDAIDQSDATDDITPITAPGIVTDIPNSHAKVAPIDYSENLNQDGMRKEHSSTRVEMQELHLAAMGFHTKRRAELLDL